MTSDKKFLSDIEIAQNCNMKSICDIAKKLDIDSKYLKLYGNYIAKVDLNYLKSIESGNKKGKLVLVTAINPTPAGEGKTTTTVGLADAMSRLNKKVSCALREPSLGPVFGIKGGAAGGGHAQVVPMEDINLHFTGDFHSISAANNLLAAMIDAHIQNDNELDIDIKQIKFKRVVDMNDRQLRHIVCGLGGPAHGVPREDGFDITVASEVMAIFCLATSISDLKDRLSKIIIGYSRSGNPITAGDLKAAGAMTALLKDALAPNLVQTLEGTPAFIHGGPFANIAHGCNSLIATETSLNLSDYCITEAGFGADLGAEKFFDIKCRLGNLVPNVVVLVATIRALKYHGRVDIQDLDKENLNACKQGLSNLIRHIENIKGEYNLPVVVAINKFASDTSQEIQLVTDSIKEKGVPVVLSEGWEKGGEGCIDLANVVIDMCEEKSKFTYLYGDNDSIPEKIERIAKKIYHADGVIFSDKAKKNLEKIEQLGVNNVPVCIAKTQYSFSDNKSLLGAPNGFNITINDIKINNGAGFIVAIAGNIMTMPGLGKHPAAHNIDVGENGEIIGLF